MLVYFSQRFLKLTFKFSRFTGPFAWHPCEGKCSNTQNILQYVKLIWKEHTKLKKIQVSDIISKFEGNPGLPHPSKLLKNLKFLDLTFCHRFWFSLSFLLQLLYIFMETKQFACFFLLLYSKYWKKFKVEFRSVSEKYTRIYLLIIKICILNYPLRHIWKL